MLNMFRGGRASLIVGVVVWFTTAALAEGPLKFRDSQFEPIKWSELAGWTADDHLAAYTAYQTSCQALLKSRRSDGGEGLPRALSNVCRKAAGSGRRIPIPLAPSSSRTFNPCASVVWGKLRDC